MQSESGNSINPYESPAIEDERALAATLRRQSGSVQTGAERGSVLCGLLAAMLFGSVSVGGTLYYALAKRLVSVEDETADADTLVRPGDCPGVDGSSSESWPTIIVAQLSELLAFSI